MAVTVAVAVAVTVAVAMGFIVLVLLSAQVERIIGFPYAGFVTKMLQPTD